MLPCPHCNTITGIYRKVRAHGWCEEYFEDCGYDQMNDIPRDSNDSDDEGEVAFFPEGSNGRTIYLT